MKRFYCTICQKVKRVQNFPVSISNPDADSPNLRQGVCNKHMSPREVIQSFTPPPPPSPSSIPVMKVKKSRKVS